MTLLNSWPRFRQVTRLYIVFWCGGGKKWHSLKKKRVTIVNGRKEVFVSMIKLAENNYYIMK